MTFSRRDFLKMGGLSSLAAAVTACGMLEQELAQRQTGEAVAMPALIEDGTADRGPLWRLLNRAGYGPRPGELAAAQAVGYESYLEQQLHPEQIEDKAVDMLERRLTLYQMDNSQLIEQDEKDAVRELIGSTLMRMVYSKKQLFESIVEFWSDHFNIYVRKAEPMPMLKIIDDRDVLRPYALGNFRDLIGASARSQAMLLYLDNVRNNKEDPNENYARELMELHTLGVDGGYSQDDVQEVARVLSGWTVQPRGLRKGQVQFLSDRHDFAEKQILEFTFPPGRGEQELDDLLNILAAHPSTAHFLATKLVRRYVSDQPPEGLVDRVAMAYTETDGEIKGMLRVIFLSEEFRDAPPKLKRPLTFLISAVRALNAALRPSSELGQWLGSLGQLPFHWPPPDGFPDVSSAWATNLLPRWNFASLLARGHLPGVTLTFEEIIAAANVQKAGDALQLFAPLLFGRALDEERYKDLLTYAGNGLVTEPAAQNRLKNCLALLIASPAFQWH